jgi:hypothetical protein
MTSKPQKPPASAETEVIDAWTIFQIALTKRGPYPMKELRLLFESVIVYSKAIEDSEFIHKSIAGTFRNFTETLEIERKRVPGDAIALGDRLETILFDGYDPYFDGDEPPGL